MITYKNISCSAKTFYGVKFESGEQKSVPGYINNPCMVRIFGVQPTPETMVSISEPRGKKKKTTEPEKDSVAEKEIKLTQEETSDGN